MMEKPDIDHIEGLSPAISIEQNRPRTIQDQPSAPLQKSTTTCVSYSHASAIRCPTHDITLKAQTVSQMVDTVMAMPEGERLMLLAPL